MTLKIIIDESPPIPRRRSSVVTLWELLVVASDSPLLLFDRKLLWTSLETVTEARGSEGALTALIQCTHCHSVTQ
jgi:hypothetical protein